ncbi:MAG: glutamyl-tRNA reductase [Polyangiaceae bacterium]|nr:glutamyl-tRNA reductase [Polyangiaceae bacterium]MCW5789193.1 glutamyl-tRNA reductase [Polyangiaceae bacterium]
MPSFEVARVIVVVGLSHRTAPIDVRERLAVSSEELPRLLRTLREAPVLGEVMVISTCNRLEVVAAVASGADAEAALRAIQTHLNERAPGVLPHLYAYPGAEGVRHLFRVAASLDSLVVGEPQILGQVKDAYEAAQQAGTIGGELGQVVPRALRAAKRIRTETAIGAGMVSVPSVAVDLAQQIFGELSKRTVALLGAGEMALAVAKLLRQSGAEMVVVGRNPARVAELCAEVGGRGRSFGELEQVLTEADVVVSSTSAPGYVVDLELVKRVRRPRRGRSLFFIDLAVPRDVDPQCELADNVFVYNIDDFSRIAQGSQEARRQEAALAEQIVEEAARGYDRWAEAAQVTPVILALREAFGRVLAAELDRSLRGKLKHLGEAERAALERMVDSALNKLTHTPSQRLREAATARDDGARLEELIGSVKELFELERAAPSEELGAARDPATDSE